MDRNVDPDKDTLTDDVSLSARRAWIEIPQPLWPSYRCTSLSARRAWIEIYNLSDIDDKFGGRSPQGERG